MNEVPLNQSNEDLLVNFLQHTEYDAEGRVLKRFSWVTDFTITEENAELLMRGGRSRWKIENETFNTLKNQGYHFEHNYGHGKQHLSVVLAMLMMLAFLLDQVQRGCVGCHESQGTVYSGVSSLALQKGPVRPTPPPWGPKYHLGYRQDIQPILDTYCGKCHQGDGKGRKTLDMTFRSSTDGGSYTEPYLTLTLGPERSIKRFAQTLCGGGAAGTLLPMASGFAPEDDLTVAPMTAMSYRSKLVANATSGEHHKIRVDSVSARKLIAWVDLLCPYWNEDDIRSIPDPNPTDSFFADSKYPPRTTGIRPFADSPYPPRMKNAPIVNRAFCQDDYPTQAHRLR